MTIADLAGPVLMRVLPTVVAVVLATSAIAALPLVVPRLVAWVRAGDPLREPPAASTATPVDVRSDEITYSI